MFCTRSERRNWKRDSRKHILEVLAEQEMSNSSLEAMKKHFDSWSKELDKREAFVNRCRKILVEEEKRVNVHFLYNHVLSCGYRLSYLYYTPSVLK